MRNAAVAILSAIVLSHGSACGELLDISSNRVAEVGYTVRLKVDLTDVRAGERLYAIPGALELFVREAGASDEPWFYGETLKDYDRHRANYLNFPMPDGSCPVLEALIPGHSGRVGIPLGFLPRIAGEHEVVLNYGGWHWTMTVDGYCDDDMPIRPPAWPSKAEARILSPRVRSADFSSPASSNYYTLFAEKVRPVKEPIQYWTPRDHDAWVGDVAVGSHAGRLHVFYLFDRRHNRSKGGCGGHAFAHLSSTDLVHWVEHPFATTIDDWWETHGTGSPFVHQGKLCVSYGLHTFRLVPNNDGRYPEGGYWAVSEDGGFTFRKTGYRYTADQNPTMANLPDGALALYGGHGETYVSSSGDIFDLRLADDGKLRHVSGDCPGPFEWNGWHYRFQGFGCFDASRSGKVGSFEDWVKKGDDPYEALSVPMVAPFGDNRRIVGGWINHPSGWGGYLCLRELIQFPDGRLGSKWLAEAPVRGPVTTYRMQPGEKLRLRFRPIRTNLERDLVFEVDAAGRRAQFSYTGEDGRIVRQQTLQENVLSHPEVTYLAHLTGRPDAAAHYALGKLRRVDRPFDVRFSTWYDRKGNLTFFDAEIAGVRTMLSRQRGRYETPVVERK